MSAKILGALGAPSSTGDLQAFTSSLLLLISARYFAYCHPRPAAVFQGRFLGATDCGQKGEKGTRFETVYLT